MAQGGKIDSDLLAKLGIDSANLPGVDSIQAQVNANEQALADISTPFSERLQESKKQESLLKEDRSEPHLTNLNEDSMLSKKLFYSLKSCVEHPIQLG